MVIDMNESSLKTVAQLRAFLEGSLAVEFTATNNDVERYGFISAVLQRFQYGRLGRSDKGVVLRYLERTTGYSRQQLTRLVGRARHGRPLAKRYRAPVVGFVRKFTAADVGLLAHTDAVHDTLSGPATRCLLQRAYTVYGDARYARLATISVAKSQQRSGTQSGTTPQPVWRDWRSNKMMSPAQCAKLRRWSPISTTVAHCTAPISRA